MLGFDRGSACSLTVPSRPVDGRCQDAKCLQMVVSLTPSVQLSCVVPGRENSRCLCAGLFRLLTDLNRRPPPYHSGSGKGTAGTAGSPRPRKGANRASRRRGVTRAWTPVDGLMFAPGSHGGRGRSRRCGLDRLLPSCVEQTTSSSSRPDLQRILDGASTGPALRVSSCSSKPFVRGLCRRPAELNGGSVALRGRPLRSDDAAPRCFNRELDSGREIQLAEGVCEVGLDRTG